MNRTKRNLPKEAIEQLAENALMSFVLNNTHRNLKPGEIIQSLDPVKRQILKDLRSEDISNIRWPRW